MNLRLPVMSAAAAALVLSGCGSNGAQPPVGVGADPTGSSTRSAAPVSNVMPTSVSYDPDMVLTTRGPVTVIEGPKQTAELCIGAVEDSLPPQCGGPKIIGFDWSGFKGDYEEFSGVKFGEFKVEGHYDGKHFTVTKVIRAKDVPDPSSSSEDTDGFATVCPAPPGGWRVLDAKRATEHTQEQTFAAAEKLPGYADAWLDTSRNPMTEDKAKTEEDFYSIDDPKYATINVRVTKDVAGAERTLREIWGGALCVTKAEHTDKELRAIQEQLGDLPGFSSSEVSNGAAYAGVEYDDGSLQAWADHKYGKGLVVIASLLEPVKS